MNNKDKKTPGTSIIYLAFYEIRYCISIAGFTPSPIIVVIAAESSFDALERFYTTMTRLPQFKVIGASARRIGVPIVEISL